MGAGVTVKNEYLISTVFAARNLFDEGCLKKMRLLSPSIIRQH
jgi:hypothetical protein